MINNDTKNSHYLDFKKSLEKKQFLFSMWRERKGHLPYAFYSLLDGTIIGHFEEKEKINISTKENDHVILDPEFLVEFQQIN